MQIKTTFLAERFRGCTGGVAGTGAVGTASLRWLAPQLGQNREAAGAAVFLPICDLLPVAGPLRRDPSPQTRQAGRAAKAPGHARFGAG